MVKSLFSIFKDSSNSFEGQEESEKVLLLLRRHIFTILIQIVLFSLVALVPIVISVVFREYLATNDWFSLFIFASSVWYLVLWLGIFYSLTMYTLDTVIITDHRIIDNDQHGLFDRKVSELHAHRIQDVSTHTSGLIETVLKFGNITVQTAASEKQFIFHQIPNPDKVKDVIMQIATTRDSGVKAMVE